MKFGALLVSAALICIILQVKAACICNEKGTDYCEGCNSRRIVRPKHKNYDSSTDLDLPPIGDTCWCSKVKVEPASLPKPCQKHKTPSCGCNNSPVYEDSVPASSYPMPDVKYVSTKPKDDSPAADPISIGLAMKAGKSIGVPEAKLSYGFIQKPLDGLKKIYFSSVPEENLYKLKSDVITLKKRTQKPCAEEYEEEMVEEEEENDEDEEQPHLTYKQLGYAAEEFKNPKFRKVSSRYYAENEEKETPYKTEVDCGYKPGRVASYRKTKTRGDINDYYGRTY
ncbi:uncharacterized protein LOC119671339 [Teleopsis dalmanni]|uniref:uncharacterized protein LOC119671339 n=1 Tax=Teleopsis dalmanni TaxID=139649 RepID=UPI0018CFB39D|nr:uncharacterized protein LOC119671339 [Teleopsis dalmanni]